MKVVIIYRYLMVISLTAATFACAATPDKRFAETLDQIRTQPIIDVLIDSFVLSDIKGKDLGYNIEKNKTIASALEEAIIAELKDKGYDANVLFVGSGFQQEAPEESEVFHSEKWTALDTKFPGSMIMLGESSFSEESAISYFQTALIEARGTNQTLAVDDPIQDPENRAARKAILENPPTAIANSSNNLMMFIKYGNLDIPTGKKFGLGLLAGVATIAASGGSMIGILTFSEKGPIEVALLDKSNKRIIWANEAIDTAYLAAETDKIKHMLKHFPTR